MAGAEKLCNLVAVIRQGRLLAFGDPAEFRARGGQGSNRFQRSKLVLD
jgi:ABC-type multidrug transport system ATPase subunit